MIQYQKQPNQRTQKILKFKYWFFRIGSGLLTGLTVGFLLCLLLMFCLASSEYPGEQDPKLFQILMIFNSIVAIVTMIFITAYIIIKYDKFQNEE